MLPGLAWLWAMEVRTGRATGMVTVMVVPLSGVDEEEVVPEEVVTLTTTV
jgi:hypothetical protein